MIADLHIGLASSRIPGQSIEEAREMASRVLEMAERGKYRKLAIAGDLKNEFSGMGRTEWKGIRMFLDSLFGRLYMVVARGNHDNYLKPLLKEYGMELVDEIDAGKAIIHHGERLKETDRHQIIGHAHPVLKIRDDVGGIHRFPAFLHSGNVTILPAFSRLVAGMNVIRERPFGLDFMAYAITPAGVLNFGRLSSLERVMEEL